MILTCPQCATSYFVDDSRVPATGRSVKCSNCGTKWTALPDGAARPAAAPAPPPPRPAPPPPPADEVIAEAPAPEAPAPRVMRRPVRPPPPPKRSGGPVLVWVSAAAVAVGLIAGFLLFRSEIARVFPNARGVYAAIGLPADPLGLVIEKVRVDPAFQGGRPVLAVTGDIRNVRRASATAPSLKVSLLDKAGKPLAAKIAKPIDGRVPAGAVRHFAIAIVDPPASVHDLQVTFEGRPPVAGTSLPAPRAAEAVIAGPAPVEAKPLPPGSPDALPSHE